MADTEQWDVRITAPNGAEGHFTIAASEPDHKIVKAFTRFIDTARDHDADPLAGIEGVQPIEQQRRQARKQR